MREIISLHIGQAGIQIGNAIWELFTLEHKLNPDGSLASKQFSAWENLKLTSFFSQSQFASFNARAVLIDLEPTVVDEVRTSKFKMLFKPQSIVNGKEDAANNYIRGHYTIGKDLIEQVLESIRKQVEEADSIQGFMYYNSLNGGTGAGVGSLLFQRLHVDFSKKVQFCCSVVPSPHIANTVVEPYNALLGISDLMGLDLHLLVDNQALYELCTKALQIEAPNYQNINRLIAQAIASITLPMRTNCPNPMDLGMLQTNLASYQRLHFLQASHAPLISAEQAYYSSNKTEQLLASCFKTSFLSKDKSQDFKSYCSALYCRGDISDLEVARTYKSFIKRREILEHVPTNLKLSVSYESRYFSDQLDLNRTPRAMTRVFQDSGVRIRFKEILQNYDTLYRKRSFVHWYVGEGLSEGFFQCARQDVQYLANDYRQFQLDTPEAQE